MKRAVPPGIDTSLETFSVKIGGRWTTIRLEPQLMDALQDIARACGISVNQLATEVAVDRSEGSFTSALRVFILNYYRRCADGAAGGARLPVRPGIQTGRDPDYIVRRPMPLGARDAASELVALYRWWQEKRLSRKRMPMQEDVDPRVVQELGLGGLMHVVDASAADPLNYQYRLWGNRVRQSSARDFTGCRLRDLPGTEYRNTTTEDYLTVSMTGVPRLQRVDARIDEIRRVYQRLVVPFSECDGKPSRLLVAIRYESSGLLDKVRDDLSA